MQDTPSATFREPGSFLVWSERHLGIEEAVVERLEGVLKYTGEIGHFLYHAQAHLALALVVWDRGKKSKATRHLQAGFQAAREKGFHYFPFINSRGPRPDRPPGLRTRGDRSL